MDISKRILLDRIDFRGGGSLDGELLTQLLVRLRNVEDVVIPPPPPGNVSFEFIDFNNASGWIDTQLENYPAIIIVFSFSVATTITSNYLTNVPTGSYFRFVNNGTANLTLADTNENLVTMVPKENVRIMKASNKWFLDSAL